MAGTTWRELDSRQADDGRLRVRLLRNRRSHNLAVEVNDRGVERVLALPDPAWRGTLSCTRSRTCGDRPDAGQPARRPAVGAWESNRTDRLQSGSLARKRADLAGTFSDEKLVEALESGV
jgi:hypothetical protein